MGCGPSKDTGVATGNTVSSKSPLEKNTDEPNNTSSQPTTITATTAASATEDTDAVADNAKVDIQVKDVGPAAPVAPDEEREGKSVVVGSPDRYFSSRKDGEAVEGVTASTDYISTSPPSIVDGGSVVGPSEETVNTKEEEAEKKSADRSGGEEIVSKQEEGIGSSEDSGDLKEASLVEAKGTEVEVNEKENVTP